MQYYNMIILIYIIIINIWIMNKNIVKIYYIYSIIQELIIKLR